MEFINLREEALKALEFAKCSRSVVRVTRNESTVYLYKHSAIVCGLSINSSNGSTDKLANYINGHSHISKIIFPNCVASSILIRKLEITGFFEKLNRKVRIIILWDLSKKPIDGTKTVIEENNIILYNFVNSPLSYIIKESDNALIHCEFKLESVNNTIILNAVLKYTIV